MTATVLNTKIAELENKTADVSGLVKETDFNAELSDIKAKYFTTSDCNKLTSETIETKRKEKELFDKFNISSLVNSLFKF